MSTLTVRSFLALVVWTGCLAGALSLAGLPASSSHSICGPWGCGPPTQVLVACHLAWLVAMVPPAILLARWQQRPSRLVRATGLLMIMLSIAVLLMMLTYQGMVWWPQAGQWQRPYFWHRYGFSIATTVDVPIVQTLLVGTWLRRNILNANIAFD